MTFPDFLGEVVDEPLPSSLLYACIDPAVGDDLDALFRDRYEDQDTGPALRRVQVLGKKLLACAAPRVRVQDRFRNEGHPHPWVPGERQKSEEGEKLNDKDPLNLHPGEM